MILYTFIVCFVVKIIIEVLSISGHFYEDTICRTSRLKGPNKKINEFLITSKIKIHYLPPYSPNLNPIERLWKVMREKKTYNKCYEKFIDFREAIRTFFFEEIPEMKSQLVKRINDNFQKITINHINCPSK